ncbi:12803_t:CDS:2 [Entrophospora sp. SA101]|nr:12803_t:CDS:2 [Entrophospora sp. SA101]
MSSTDRYLIKPSITLHPKGSLKDPFNQLHSKNFNQLFSFIKTCQNKEFWDELNVLEKLYYKNKNQHKQFMPFALTCMSVISRLNILTKVWIEEIKISYKMLRNWIQYFPVNNEFPDSLEEIKSIQQSL